MSMQVGEHDTGEDVPMSDINTTPLVDVMLVLLIIFLITVPVVVQSVPITLPEVRYEATETKPENVSLTVRGGPGGACEVYWNLTPVNNEQLLDKAVDALEKQIAKVGGVENINEENMPEVHIRGDLEVRYEAVGRLVVACQRAGILKVGFITEPPPNTL